MNRCIARRPSLVSRSLHDAAPVGGGGGLHRPDLGQGALVADPTARLVAVGGRCVLDIWGVLGLDDADTLRAAVHAVHAGIGVAGALPALVVRGLGGGQGGLLDALLVLLAGQAARRSAFRVDAMGLPELSSLDRQLQSAER